MRTKINKFAKTVEEGVSGDPDLTAEEADLLRAFRGLPVTSSVILDGLEFFFGLTK